MDRRFVELEDKCENIVVDGAGHYCRALCLPEPMEDYPHKYRRVECHGRKDEMICKELKRKYSLSDELEAVGKDGEVRLRKV